MVFLAMIAPGPDMLSVLAVACAAVRGLPRGSALIGNGALRDCCGASVCAALSVV
jgi:hypothetical protein